jgi:hypothetical protein
MICAQDQDQKLANLKENIHEKHSRECSLSSYGFEEQHALG